MFVVLDRMFRFGLFVFEFFYHGHNHYNGSIDPPRTLGRSVPRWGEEAVRVGAASRLFFAGIQLLTLSCETASVYPIYVSV